jgi:Flp pilus assembly protein TadD
MRLAALLLAFALALSAQDLLVRVQQLLQQGDWAAAKREIQSGLEETPGEPVLWNFLGIAAAQEGRWAESEKAFATALRLRPGMKSALDNQARMRSSQAAALQEEGKFTESQLTLGKLPPELRAQPDVLALRYVNEVKLRQPAAAKATAAKLASAPEGLHALGSAQARAGQLAESRKSLEAFVQQQGKATPELLTELAQVAHRQKDLQGALGYLAHARDLDAKNAGIHFFFGMICVEMDLPVEAEKSLKTAVELDPNNAYYNYALGGVVGNFKKWSEAIPYFEKYSQLNPSDARGRLALASAYFYDHDHDKATELLKGLEANPETAAGATFYLGQIDCKNGEYEACAAKLKKASALSPGNAEILAELGFAEMQLGHSDAARRTLETSLKLRPENVRANMVLLALYQKTGDPREAGQKKRLESAQAQRAEKVQQLLRTIEARPQ